MDEDQKQSKKSNISIKKLRLNNLTNIKKSLARIANEMLVADKDNGDITRLRSTAYVLNILVAAYKVDFENRLEALEDLVNEKQD